MVKNYDPRPIDDRVNYYNKLHEYSALTSHALRLDAIPFPRRIRTYYFDTVEYTRYFRPDLKIHYLYGDIIHVPEEPTITKSRPIQGDNVNSVLLNLDKLRHFVFIEKDVPFTSKRNQLIWRGVVKREHRIRFLEMHFKSPWCNLGKINKDGGHPEWITRKISINEHLQYKFILCIEGNDVASNLKWVMSSNSIAVMPKPRYETWFMEGRLVPDKHYILIKDDYSDLEERLNYFTEHIAEALQIIQNAHDYIDGFRDQEKEELLSLLVLQKYFAMTQQTKS